MLFSVTFILRSKRIYSLRMVRIQCSPLSSTAFLRLVLFTNTSNRLGSHDDHLTNYLARLPKIRFDKWSNIKMAICTYSSRKIIVLRTLSETWKKKKQIFFPNYSKIHKLPSNFKRNSLLNKYECYPFKTNIPKARYYRDCKPVCKPNLQKKWNEAFTILKTSKDKFANQDL